MKTIGNRGWLVDLIHSIGEKLALCDHLAEEIDNPLIQSLYLEIVEERRNEMHLLATSVPNCHPEYWCAFKHALKAWVLAIECYDAMPNDQTLTVARQSSNILAGVMSLFLGLEFGTCARCIYDQLLTLPDAQNKTKKGV